MYLELNNSIFLTIISINMTIIGLTSLAEKKNVIGVDYGKYLINEYKLFRTVPLYLLLIVFAVINVLALFTLFYSGYNFRIIVFICLTVCLSFAIYYFFGFILRENSSVKKQLYENEFIGLYYKDGTPPAAECDLLVKMNCGFRTSKRLSSDVVTYFNKFNNETQKAFEIGFGPDSFIYERNPRITRKYIETIGHEPYDYTGTDGLYHISWEFFQLFRWTELQDKWAVEILILFNDRHAKDSPEMRLNNVLRVLFHVNTFGKCDSLFGYRTIDYMYKYVKDVYSATGFECGSDRRTKELKLFEYYCKYIFNSIDSHYSDQTYKLAANLFKDLIEIVGIGRDTSGRIDCNDMMRIMLSQSAVCDNTSVEDLVTAVYGHYVNIAESSDACIGLDEAKRIIMSCRKGASCGKISRSDLFGDDHGAELCA